MLAIDAVSYCYRHRQQPALQGVNLHVQAGECYGLLGPNGAGKTTLISLIAGLLPLQQGAIHFAGHPLQLARRQRPAAISLVPQDYAFYPMLRVRENLLFFAGVQGIGASQRKDRVEQAMAFGQLEQFGNRLAGELSGGLRRRLNLAIGLLGDPQLLLLDEPTVGVDPQSRHFLLDSIGKLREAGKTIIYTSHYMDEVEALCDTVAIIDHGRVLVQGSLQAILRQSQPGLSLHLASPLPAALLSAWQAPYQLQQTGSCSYHLEAEPDALPPLLTALHAHGTEVLSLSCGQQNLEQVFMQLTQRSLRD